MDKYTFSEAARSERYYTASLLCHLLLEDNFSGLKVVFHKVFGGEECLKQESDFEVVSELDPLRDGAKYDKAIADKFNEHKRVAVPDLFLRWGKLIIIFEAKFFTNPNSKDIESQVLEQKRAIGLVKEIMYTDCQFKYYTLTVIGFSEEDFKDKSIGHMSWGEVVDMLSSQYDSNSNIDINYCIDNLRCAIKRAKAELVKNSKIKFKTIADLEQFISEIPSLINNGYIYFGYSEGLGDLKKKSLQDLRDRGHYKVSKVHWGKNWYPIDLLISHVVTLKSKSIKSDLDYNF